jgi:hypothetical protein
MYDTVCPGNKSVQCMHWVAGRDYKKGEAVRRAAGLQTLLLSSILQLF